MRAQNDQLGKLIEGEGSRDAIHIAIAPVVAGEKLYPGQSVGFMNKEKNEVGVSDATFGIVDPFLPHPVHPGDSFYVLLFPNTITDLKHVWESPLFDRVLTVNVASIGESKAWLRDFAVEARLDYDEMIEHIHEFVATGVKFIQQGEETARNAYWEVDDAVFWAHVENVAGIKIDPSDWDSPFCCSC